MQHYHLKRHKRKHIENVRQDNLGAGARTDLKGKSTSTSKEKEKVASKLLSQKGKVKVDPKYKQQKATGYSTAERQKITRAGERLVRDIKKKKEKPASHYDPGVRRNK